MIARKMDIDSRRALGIYTKLKVPNGLADKITKTFVKPMPTAANSSLKKLMILQFPYCDADMKDFYLTMMDDDMRAMEDHEMKMIIYRVASWFSRYNFEAPGILVRAGYVDNSKHFHMSVYKLKGSVDFIEYGFNMENYAHTSNYNSYVEHLF